MKNFCLLVICALTLAVSICAQTSDQSSVVKTAKGFLVISNEPGNYFTAEISATTIKQDPDCPVCLKIDNKPFELVAIPKGAFLKDPVGLDDMALLIAYRNWETKSLSRFYDFEFTPTTQWIKLANGARAAVWNYEKPPRYEGDKEVRSRFALSTVKGDHLLMMDITVGKDSDAQKTQQFLVDTMNSLRTSDKPFTPEEVKALTR